MTRRLQPLIPCLVMLLLTAAAPSRAQEGRNNHAEGKTLILVEALTCEDVRENTPVGKAVAFSSTLGRVSCFTVFDQVEDKSFVYHSWFRQDSLTTKKRLALKPPRWATVSTIELRDADKGPWRVEVTDANGRLLTTLRFSVVD